MMTLWYLLAMHFLCDYPLQGDFLARGKNQHNPIPGVPWYQCLFAHAFIQATGVLLATGSIGLAGAELLAHVTIDFGKSAGRYDFNVDQALHISCKLALFIIWKYL
jgi:hypothetical protein